MRRRLFYVLILFVIIIFASCQKVSLKTNDEKASYAVGVSVAGSFLKSKIGIENEQFFQGMFDELEGKPPAISEDDMEKVILTFQQNMMQKKTNPYTFNIDSSFKNGEELFSYAIGMSLGKNFSFQQMKINKKAFEMGFMDELKGKKLLLTNDQIKSVLQEYTRKSQEKFNQIVEKQIKENTKKEKDFLAQNKDKNGVITLKDGIQYKILKAGTGPKPKPTDTVIVNYTGKLLDGTVFDSSYKRGHPMVFSLEHVIPGWKEIIPMMKVGAKWRVWIPASLGYGDRNMGPKLPAHSLLIFDIELVNIQK